MDVLRKRYGDAVRALYDPDTKVAEPLDADIVFSTVVYAEYFYTGMPQCYLLEGEATLLEQFLPFAKTLAEHVRKAHTDEDVIGFIRDVAAGRDLDRDARAAFAAKEVCVNHPGDTAAVIAALGFG